MSSWSEDGFMERFESAWNAVRVVRDVSYSLFTFGESDLPYFLVCDGQDNRDGLVTVTRGEVKVTRPTIITPDNAGPEIRDFFDNDGDTAGASFLLARTAAFSNLKFTNQQGPARIVTDNVEEACARISKQLDDTDEDRVAILTAPKVFAGFAIFRYAVERVRRSAPDNIQELRERGFLP
jgi:hypothetical protein